MMWETVDIPPRHEWQGFLRSPRWFCGNLWVPPATGLLQRRTTKRLNFWGYPPVGLLDASNTMPKRKAIAYPGLNAGACAQQGSKRTA